MNCKNCNSQRVLDLGAKCSDCCSYSLGDLSGEGYVPSGLGIGGGDYVEFNLCLDCGKVQGDFPLPISEIEKDISDKEVTDFFNDYFTEGKQLQFSLHYRNELVESAHCLCKKFGKWFERFMYENNGMHNNVYGNNPNLPSVEKFVQMYRDNDIDIV